MRIHEILTEDDIEPDAELQKVKRSAPYDFDYLKRRRGQTMMGHGAFGAYSWGRPDPRNPHEFIKGTHLPSEMANDAYFWWVKTIQPHKAENPYLPRVRVTQLVKDPNNLIKPRYRMEALKKPTEFEPEAIMALGERMFPGFRDAGFDKPDDSWYLWRMIVNRVENLYDYNNQDRLPGWYTEDQQLIQAVDLVRHLVRHGPPGQRSKFILDMKADNFMARATSVGPQFVFTDPVQDRGASIIGR